MINKKKVYLGLSIFLLTSILLFSAYTWLVLTWSFSDGERAGSVQKFSKKGWLCKTWEGEMMMLPTSAIVVPEKFMFSVRDEAVAKQITANIGKRMTLTYSQHVGVPTTCFAETEYFVEKVVVDK